MDLQTRLEAMKAYVLGGLATAFAVVIVGVFGFAILDRYLINSPSLAAVISAVLVDLTNSERAAYTVGGLRVNPVLTAAAQAKANDMAAKSYFAHVSPDGRNSWFWFRQAGYSFIYAGENLAVDFSDSGDVERAWMNSPTHRRNILDANFTEIGIATAQGTYQGHPTTFVVQMFGTPAPVATAPVREIASPAEPTEPALATTEEAAPAPVVAGAASTTTVATSSLALETASTTVVLGTESAGLYAPAAAASWWQHLLASPKEVLRYAYYLLAALVLITLAYVTELEFHKRHMRHLTAALVLIVLMVVLLLVANAFFFAAPTIAAIAPAL